MSVLAINLGDKFVYRITKSLGTNPDRKWANTYEFVGIGAGTEGDLLDLGEVLVNFEIQMHHGSVVFDRLLISTWAPDSVPYDPTAFISSTLTASGGRGGLADLRPLTDCLSVTRQAASGRFGHIFYRGFLLEDDSSAPAGKSVLNNRATLQTNMDAAITSTGLADYIGPDARLALKLCMISKDGSQVRDVINLRVQGVSSLPLDHAWFNRTSPTP